MSSLHEDDYQALRQGCALAAGRPGAGKLALSGADRQRFLNAYVTCDVKTLGPGRGAYGFFTNKQGHVLSDVVVMVGEASLWLQLPPGQEEAIAAHLRRYLIADRVEIAPLAEHWPLTVAGPGAAALLAACAGEAALPAGLETLWSHARMGIAGREVLVQHAGRLGTPGYTLWVVAAEAAGLERDLQAAGARPAGVEALERLRIESGIARLGAEIGANCFPQETGAEAAAVSYAKGCYLGQEVVARIHYRGGVQKALCGLRFDPQAPDGPPAHGTPLVFEGREAGTVGSAALSAAAGGPIGLAILHKRAAAPGTRLEVGEAGGRVAEVAALPFLA